MMLLDFIVVFYSYQNIKSLSNVYDVQLIRLMVEVGLCVHSLTPAISHFMAPSAL